MRTDDEALIAAIADGWAIDQSPYLENSDTLWYTKNDGGPSIDEETLIEKYLEGKP